MAKWSRSFQAHLEDWAVDADLRERRFVARNHLLDERPSARRIASYDELGSSAVSDFDDWYVQHEAYLDQHVRGRPNAGLRQMLMRSDAPDTFIVNPQLTPYSHAAHGLDLVHVWRADTLARLSARSLNEVLSVVDDALAMEAVLEDVNAKLDVRPTFAAFLEDVAALLPDDEDEAPEDWADQLRDVLGLWHISPPPGDSVPVVVFRYAVGEVVRLQGMGTDRPLTVPTVVDVDQFEAFCPAPITIPIGQLVELAGDLVRDPAGEVLHPGMPLRVSQVYRLGYVRKASPSLDRARGAHLTWLQVRTGSDYGSPIDDDVMSL